MAQLNIAIAIAAQDNASGPLGTITGALSGLADIAGGAAAVALGNIFTGALSSAKDALGDFFTSALDAEQQQISLANLVKNVNSTAVEQAARLAAAQKTTVTTTMLSGDALAKLQDQLTHATAKLDDMTAAYPKLKHPTEEQTLALEDQRKKVADLTAQLAAGSQTITTTGQAMQGLASSGTFSIDVVNRMANQFRDLVGGSRETALSIEEIGIRSGQISQNEMPQFIQNVADLGAVMGDTSTAATLLARAQDDPEAAFKRIEKATGAYDDSLAAQIKSMQKAGDVAGATGLIMQFVAEKTGGEAAANAKSLGGEWEILTNHLKTAGTDVALKLLPPLESLFDQYIAPNIPVVEALAGSVADRLGPAMQGLVGTINAVVQGGGPALATMLQGWGQKFVAWIAPMLPPMLLELGKLEAQAWSWVVAQAPAWLAQLEAWGRQLAAWVRPYIPPLIAEAQKLAAQLWAWIQAQIPPLVAQLQAWGRELWAWVGPMIPPLVAELGKLAGELWAWIVAQIPPLTAQLLLWGEEFVNWVGPQIPPLLAQLGVLLGQLSAWAWGTALPEIVKQLAQWAFAFMDWVMKPGGAKDQVLPALSQFLLAVGKFVDTDLLPGFVDFAHGFVTSLISGLGDKIPALLTAAEGIGTAIINHIRDAITSAVQGLIDAAVKAVQSAISAAASAAASAVGSAADAAKQAAHNAGVPGFASGANFVVPGGFPNDTFLMGVTSGERVTVTPAGQETKGGAGQTVNYNYYVTGQYAYQDERTLSQDLALLTRLRPST